MGTASSRKPMANSTRNTVPISGVAPVFMDLYRLSLPMPVRSATRRIPWALVIRSSRLVSPSRDSRDAGSTAAKAAFRLAVVSSRLGPGLGYWMVGIVLAPMGMGGFQRCYYGIHSDTICATLNCHHWHCFFQILISLPNPQAAQTVTALAGTPPSRHDVRIKSWTNQTGINIGFRSCIFVKRSSVDYILNCYSALTSPQPSVRREIYVEGNLINEFDELRRDPFHILQDKKVFDSGGNRLRAATRDDIMAVLEQNDGTAHGIRFDRIDLTGADLRGLDLSGASFNGCDLTNADASPLVTRNGVVIQHEHEHAILAMEQWESRQSEDLKAKGIQVCPTSFEKAMMVGATLTNANFNFAQMEKANLREVDAEGTSFYKTDLRNANMRIGRRWTRVDLRGADLRNADFFASRFDSPLLEGTRWGRHWIIKQEERARRPNLDPTSRMSRWEDAVLVYRELVRVHESIGAGYVAGQFRYRREWAQSRFVEQRALRLKAGVGLIGWANSLRRWKFVRQYCGVWWWRRCALEWLHGYGERPLRVIRAMLLVAVIFSFVHFEFTSFEPSWGGALEFLIRTVRAVYFSSVSTAAPGFLSWGNSRQLLEWQSYFGGAQSSLGIFLNALFIVTFARRWIR